MCYMDCCSYACSGIAIGRKLTNCFGLCVPSSNGVVGK